MNLSIRKTECDEKSIQASIEWDNPIVSINSQCRLLSLSKSSLYFSPGLESTYNLNLMDLIDKQFLETPFFGSRRMAVYLNTVGHDVNRKRVQRLMRVMGIEGVCPRKNTSKKNHAHKIYPYLLRGLKIHAPHHVWASDITYLRIFGGYVFLTCVMDWFSRSILSWKLSNSLETSFCTEALEDAFENFGTPEIFNTDQGCQYTSESFTGRLLERGIKISMDGKGRALDNVMVERLWRTIKYEEVYLKNYAEKPMPEVYEYLAKYIDFYNNRRWHSSLRNKTPYGVLCEGKINDNRRKIIQCGEA